MELDDDFLSPFSFAAPRSKSNDKNTTPQKRRSLRDRIKSDLPEREMSKESDEGSVRARFLKAKKIKDDNSSTESSSCTF
ncbi:hypothetical protein TELCIR_10924 [Teladorsagia circumcincta]|uniref:Uncharacterized protein n=1 Tax=Teladorsagia circumcincta TaxID=45464 RepID=A0A2G9UD04_TELCI|nr:hypothetical protein TELCIR_10924 [Teladorsagia circumcincta]